MKNIRHGLFETNSSSVHTITLCTENEYNEFINGNLFISGCDKLYTKGQVIDKILDSYLNNHSDYEYTKENLEDLDSERFACVAKDYCNMMNYEQWVDSIGYLEEYAEEYTTPNGETVVAFGYYGHD